MTDPFVLSAPGGVARLDPKHWSMLPRVSQFQNSSLFDTVALGTLALSMTYGTSARSTADIEGVPVLRMANMQNDAWDLTEVKYAPPSQVDLDRVGLETGDLLITRTNGSPDLVGKSAVWNGPPGWAFASYLIRIRLDRSRCDPGFVAHFLNSSLGRMQVRRQARQITVTNITQAELARILVPVPPVEVQVEMSANVEEALLRLERMRDQSFRDQTEEGPEFQRLLQVSDLSDKKARAWQVVLEGSPRRLDPGFHGQGRYDARQSAGTSASAPSQELGSLADLVSDRTSQVEGEFVGLGRVQQQIGVILPADPDDTATSAFRFEPGDVLLSRLRPNLNKVWLADRSGCCSSEFRVLRVPASSPVTNAYLAIALRFPVVVSQLTAVATGNTHPRVSDHDLLRCLVPVPKADVQKDVVRILSEKRSETNMLVSSAIANLKQTKDQFVAQLVGREVLDGW